MSAGKMNASFEKSYIGFSYILSPAEERFLKHMKEIQFLERQGEKTDFTRAEYMHKMGLQEYTFDRCAKNLCNLGLIYKTTGSSRNRVRYRLNDAVYNRLVKIVSQTRNTYRLKQFFDFHIFKLGKRIEDLTDSDIEGLIL